jgi:negative regulator of sigma E activity
MTHDERISSYIDNELSVEQEQEFLISLAASDGLRKSFRSELVLKKVLHHDEAATNPPRKLRSAVFATLGLGGAVAGAHHASAAEPAAHTIGLARPGLVQSLFATKMSTLLTVVGISASALAGYGVRSITSPSPMISPSTSMTAPSTERSAKQLAPVSAEPQPILNSPAAVPLGPVASTLPAATTTHHRSSTHSRHNNGIALKKETVNSAAGTGVINMDPPKIERPH